MSSQALRYEVTGDGPPVVLIHGLGTTSDVWYSLRAALDQGFRVITYDRSGCGLSPRKSGGYSVAAWVAVKYRWGLAMDDAERQKVDSVLASCPTTGVALPEKAG